MAIDTALLSVLPDWIVYARFLIGLPTAFAATFVGTWFGAHLVLPNTRALEGLHWAERARSVHPARIVVGFFAVCAPMVFGQFFGISGKHFDGLPSGLVGLLAALSAFAGATLASRAVHRRITGESVSWARHTRNQLLTLGILMPHVLVLFFMLLTVGGDLDRMSVACAIAGCAAMVFSARYSGLPMARLFGAVRPASSRLARHVDELSRETGVVPRSVEEVDLGLANAFALPSARRLIFTPQLVTELDDEGLRGVIAHELGHLNDPNCARVVFVGVLAFLPLGFVRPATALYGFAGLVGIYLVFMTMLTLSTRLGRQGEERADAAVSGADVDGADYARALETLHVQNLSPAVMSNRTSHPSLYDRMVSAGLEPDFARPMKPSAWRAWVGCAAATIGTVLVVLAVFRLPVLVSEPSARAERKAQLRLAWRGANGSAFFALARERMVQGRDDEAVILVDAAIELRPQHHAYRAARANLFGDDGQCQLAAEALETAIQAASAGHRDSCLWLERATASVATCEAVIAHR